MNKRIDTRKRSFPTYSLQPTLDGRRKIDPKDHEQIRRDYQDLKSQRKVADLWGVSRRLISFILDPHKLEEFQRKRYEKGVWMDYYDKEKRREAMAKYRKKKRDLGFKEINTAQ